MSNVVEDYSEFLNKVGRPAVNNVDVTHDGYPLSIKESKFITLFLTTNSVPKALKGAGLTYRSIEGKQYLTDEVKYRLDLLKKQSIADTDEILQYFTRVMRGEEKDQFGLEAPLCERTKAAQELAKRIIDVDSFDETVPEIRVTLNWEGL